ncbi:flavin reductase family protein [Burkholderia multivorans]|uniref:flavin reductase family protein n=1 Tax=Burkholderia multivorans TaxID=87883 RepID=UPI00158C2A83|nr:flavin reductase family protein [Burkholderia multivorans]
MPSQLLHELSRKLLIKKEIVAGKVRALEEAPSTSSTEVINMNPLSTIADLDAAQAVAADFRNAMRRLASSVTLVTSLDEYGAPHGMAASAVIPVSMDPPSMLVAANRSSGLHPVVRSRGSFCVNLLADNHQELLLPFSQSARRTERFAAGGWREGYASLLYLPSAPAAMFCELDQEIDYGTHTLFVGRVMSVRLYDEECDPLLWYNGAGTSVSRPRAFA